jgi:FlaA1/EpsC-like NDP-sugar epimerase
MNQSKILQLIGRTNSLFATDLSKHEAEIAERIKDSRFLVIGGAGSIGGAVVEEIFRRGPKALHVVDISENNLAETVRNLRSSLGYIDGDFRTFALDAMSPEFDAFGANNSEYDYVLNFSALKHVRSEKDPFTLMRMIRTNIFLTKQTLEFAETCGAKKYFCVSTDKASNPVNMMGCSKRIMELFLLKYGKVPVSSARFANVAFSDGSLLHSFRQRLTKGQPLAAPNDVKRYFVTAQEGALLCLFSIFYGEDRDIFFPKLTADLHLETFDKIAVRFLESCGYEAHVCKDEDEARASVEELSKQKKWPCCFFTSDTTGEKDFEEFFTDNESVNWDRFNDIGIVKNNFEFDGSAIESFESYITDCLQDKSWDKAEMVKRFLTLVPNFEHEEKNKNLDNKM